MNRFTNYILNIVLVVILALFVLNIYFQEKNHTNYKKSFETLLYLEELKKVGIEVEKIVLPNFNRVNYDILVSHLNKGKNIIFKIKQLNTKYNKDIDKLYSKIKLVMNKIERFKFINAVLNNSIYYLYDLKFNMNNSNLPKTHLHIIDLILYDFMKLSISTNISLDNLELHIKKLNQLHSKNKFFRSFVSHANIVLKNLKFKYKFRKFMKKENILNDIDKLKQTIIRNEQKAYQENKKFHTSLIIVLLILILIIYILIKEQNRLRHLQEQLLKQFDANVIASKTDLRGIITYASEAFCKISKYSQKELIGHSHNIIRDPNMPKKAFKELWQTIKDGKTWKGEISNKAKDGTIYYTVATISPDYDEDNQIIGYSAIRQDITNKKKLDILNNELESKVIQRTKELNKLNEELEERIKIEMEKNIQTYNQLVEQSKLAQMGEMIGNIAHQWRQPLSAISSLSSGYKLQKELGLITEEEIEQAFADITKHTKFLSQTIEDFRNFFKEDKEITIIDAKQLIKGVILIVKDTYKHHDITIEFLTDEEIKFKGYKSELSQVILNILNNAKDAFIESNIKENRKVVINYYIEDNIIIITIKDNAGGIPKDIINKIFNPYFTTKHQSQGTGIGLYMSSQIIKNHHKGKLTAYNDDNGAVFKIEIPKID